ncbi:hypothetical protein GO988_06600 [Hymenobacter sp. HMF4947]|uniref:Uncharacterized protein n=1 Tax=Hymenobacter ginkgonis TaxID=2682976 RepID=A0A7K1TC66_9BACT|nr:DUF6624 domain-containing protein [Hymenobacter ginkgonis]MVN75989.1 hypothetical protein [Hymenobacter ginkgonis]
MRLLFTLILLLLTPAAFAQTKLNLSLKRELDSMYVQDQQYRVLLVGLDPRKDDSLAAALHLPKGQLFSYIYTNLSRVDSLNLRRVEAIIQRYGYPGKSLVGTPANETVWNVIQHSAKIPQYLPLVKAAAENSELPYRLYAQMLDRQLKNEGQEQVYGTQGASFNVLNTATGQPEMISFIWPVKDAAHVNERRRKVGFPTTVEASAAILGIPYKSVSLAYAMAVKKRSDAYFKQRLHQ